MAALFEAPSSIGAFLLLPSGIADLRDPHPMAQALDFGSTVLGANRARSATEERPQ